MKIVCADSLTLGEETFTTIGDVTSLPEAEITRETLMNADALIVRSKTQVNAELLEDTPVKFVATATAGTDHIDQAWLEQAGIAFRSAAGCNAPAVGQYLTAALIYLSEKYDVDLQGKTLGIVGHGNVGKQVEKKALALGMKVLLSDPPLFDKTNDPKYLPLKQLVTQSDFLSLHVPLIDDGPHPTRDFISEEHLRAMPSGSFLINACRGEVIPTGAIANTLRDGILQGAVLDVWNPEPGIPTHLLDMVDLGSSHIAGHSFEGKLNGTLLCYIAACQHFGCTPDFDAEPLTPSLKTTLEHEANSQAISAAVRASYDITTDDHLLRESICPHDPKKSITAFRKLRSGYRLRREFEDTTVTLIGNDPTTENTLRALGFNVHVR